MPIDVRRVETWEQLTLGGGVVRFHAETVGNMSTYWECMKEECDDCRTYDQGNKR